MFKYNFEKEVTDEFDPKKGFPSGKQRMFRG